VVCVAAMSSWTPRRRQKYRRGTDGYIHISQLDRRLCGPTHPISELLVQPLGSLSPPHKRGKCQNEAECLGGCCAWTRVTAAITSARPNVTPIPWMPRQSGGHELNSTFWSANYSPDGGRIVMGSRDMTARVWDIATKEVIMTLRGHGRDVYSASFRPDGKLIVTASFDNTARVWDAATGKEVVVLRGHKGKLTSAAFSPDGNRIITASEDHTARIWNAANGNELLVLRANDNDIGSATFSPDATRIAAVSGGISNYAETARIWDAATAEVIAVLRGHESYTISAAFSPDGSRIVTASADTTVRIWDVRFATMTMNDLGTEVCKRRLLGISKLSRDEMRLAGYPDNTSEIDTCAGFEYDSSLRKAKACGPAIPIQLNTEFDCGKTSK
jgi:WD40 repeat protein